MTRPRVWTAPAMVAIVPVAAVAVLLVAAPTRGGESPTRRVTLHFYGPAGHRETVVVAMPAWYGPTRHPALPLVISPHGRGGSAAGNARRWGDLPARLGLIVLDAGLSGRRLQRESWAWPPEIDELARLPEIVRRRLPYLRFDPRRVYAAGDSMGGQEALMLLARHPDLLAAAAAADPVTNFLERQRQFPRSADSRGEQRRARLEVGASPARAPWLYLRRSPSAYAATIAFAGVPTRLWWSRRDHVVIDQRQTQAGELFKAVKHLKPRAPISERITQDRHGWIFWSDHGLREIARWLLRHRRGEPPALQFVERDPASDPVSPAGLRPLVGAQAASGG